MSETHRPRGTLDHHFLEGRQYRADEIGEVIAHRNWWRLATFSALALAGVSMLGNIYLGSLPKQVPYPIRWDSASGDMHPLAVAVHAGQEPVTMRLWLREFVSTLRGISTDKELMRQQWNRAMVRLTNEGKARLVAYEAQVKPLKQQEPVKVEILHMLRQTKSTWDVRWQETRSHAGDGSTRTVKTYRGLFTFHQRTPRTQDELEYNPAGIFFHEWSWSDE
jgi:type IV secretory pathway TrbF-like protein